MRTEVRQMFEGTNVCHVATVMPDGSPHSVPVWVDVLDDDRVAFFSGNDTRKARNLARDPRVAISMVDSANPYRTGRVRGRVSETLEGDEGMAIVDRLSRKYTGRDFPMRDRVAFVVAVENDGFMELPFEPPPR